MEAANRTKPPKYLYERCTNCCRWAGEVKASEKEITAIASFLKVE
jgi:hypothetical protein